MKKISDIKRQSFLGVTLLEIIISLAILGIIVVGLLPAFVSGTKWTFDSGRRTKAALVASKFLDKMYSVTRSVPTSPADVDVIANSLMPAYPEITDKTLVDHASNPASRIDLGNGRYAAGTEMTITCTIDGKEEKITTFVPQYP